MRTATVREEASGLVLRIRPSEPDTKQRGNETVGFYDEAGGWLYTRNGSVKVERCTE